MFLFVIMNEGSDWNRSQSTTIINEMCLQNRKDNDIVALYRSVFTDPRHVEEICKAQKSESPNVRAKDRVCLLFFPLFTLLRTFLHFFLSSSKNKTFCLHFLLEKNQFLILSLPLLLYFLIF